MIKKTQINENIKKMTRIAKSMPKTINEALCFEDDDVDMEYEDDAEEQEPVTQEPVKQGPIDVASFVDEIRKKSLKGMAELAENPESQDYQLLKKIWQICDKKPEEGQVQTDKTRQM